jgi:predicted amidophosphoribosyltransferase
MLTDLVALIAPPSCVSCRAPTGAGERLCARCVRALPWLRRGCPRCALPNHRGRTCPASNAAYSRAWAPMAYEGVARDLVTALKFRSALPIADLMAAHMAANLPPDLRRTANAATPQDPPALRAAMPGAGEDAWFGGGARRGAGEDGWVGGAAIAVAGGGLPAIVPVPTVAARRRRRGFDPATTLAVALARRLDRPLVACLERRDRSSRQVGTSRRERRAPGRLEFSVNDPPACVLLVDDVHTTGATFDAAARGLVWEGVRIVAALSYARTL